MSDLERILWTAATTIFGGVVIFVFGQVTSRFLIEPWYEQRKVIGLIAESLLNYAYLFADSGGVQPEIAVESANRLRQLSSELMARTAAIPGYGVLAALGVVCPWRDIVAATRGLVGLSNTLSRNDWVRKMSLASQVAVSLRIDRIDPGMFSKESIKQLTHEGHNL
jgi:hypothetical protein